VKSERIGPADRAYPECGAEDVIQALEQPDQDNGAGARDAMAA
jgi:hypothetical protein